MKQSDRIKKKATQRHYDTPKKKGKKRHSKSQRRAAKAEIREE